MKGPSEWTERQLRWWLAGLVVLLIGELALMRQFRGPASIAWWHLALLPIPMALTLCFLLLTLMNWSRKSGGGVFGALTRAMSWLMVLTWVGLWGAILVLMVRALDQTRWGCISVLAILLVLALASYLWKQLRFRKKGYRAASCGRDEMRYEEAADGKSRFFVLSAELGGDGRTVSIPDPEPWAVSMPTWARGRRDEIVERIRTELGTKRYRYVAATPRFPGVRVIPAEARLSRLEFQGDKDSMIEPRSFYACPDCGEQVALNMKDLQKHSLSSFTNLSESDARAVSLAAAQVPDLPSAFLDFYCPGCRRAVRVYYEFWAGGRFTFGYILRFVVEAAARADRVAVATDAQELPAAIYSTICPRCQASVAFAVFQDEEGTFATYLGGATGALYRLDLDAWHYRRVSVDAALAPAAAREGGAEHLHEVPGRVRCGKCSLLFEGPSLTGMTPIRVGRVLAVPLPLDRR